MGKLSPRHKIMCHDIQQESNKDLTAKHCLTHSYSAIKARNLSKVYKKIENKYLKNINNQEHFVCCKAFEQEFTRCKVIGVFEAVGRIFTLIITVPIDILRTIFTCTLDDCGKYTKGNIQAIADSFTKPSKYANEFKALEKKHRHSPKGKKQRTKNLFTR